jgi:hypothetical protein
MRHFRSAPELQEPPTKLLTPYQEQKDIFPAAKRAQLEAIRLAVVLRALLSPSMAELLPAIRTSATLHSTGDEDDDSHVSSKQATISRHSHTTASSICNRSEIGTLTRCSSPIAHVQHHTER